MLQEPAGPWANVRLLHAQALPGESFATRADALMGLVAICGFLVEGGLLEDEKRRALLDGEDGPVGKAFVEICEVMTELERSAVLRLTVMGGNKVKGMVGMFHEMGVLKGVVEGYKMLVGAEMEVCVSASAFAVSEKGDEENEEMDGDEGVSLIGV
jgi:hypothetical protein